MSLTVCIKHAVNLPNKESMGKSDPYVTVSFQGQKKKTTVKDGTLDPVWDETIEFDIGLKPPRPDEVIDIVVKDYERLSWNKLIGKTIVPLRNLIQGTGTLELEQSLMDQNDQPTLGKLTLSCAYAPHKSCNTDDSHTQQSRAEVTKRQDVSNQNAATLSGHQQKSPTTATNTPPEQLRAITSNTKTNFQVRFRIIEARQLMGEDLNPICHVSLGSKIQQTKIVRSTNSPWFDQLFYYHMEKVPSEFLTQIIEFRVCNSRMLRSESVIGSFKCEVGQIYDRPSHAILNKWLVLSHPDEPTPTVQGYLKISASVIGHGDSAPDFGTQGSDDDDVETNLLWSAGVHLQPAYFTLSIYVAENLPRMDSGAMQTLKEILGIGKASKELVDPYLIVSYAGREIQTKVLYTDDNPEFKQQIHMGFLFPSMCKTIKLTLKDWDRAGEDDHIGCASIAVGDISAQGDEGYLPTFGPSFINVYGGRREWELWDGKEKSLMNEGIEKGCSYRGRVLVSLKTTVGSYPPSILTDMDGLTFDKVTRYRSTRTFVVVAHLSHAFRLKETNKPQEIEVSIGNFGNKLENTLLPSPSSSHPCNPLFDGCKYYFLPWGDSCPFIVVQCEWEDTTHRLFTANAIEKVHTNVTKALEKLKSIAKSKQKKRHERKATRDDIQECLHHISYVCSLPLPHSDPVRNSETSLDVVYQKRRKLVLEEISSKASLIRNESLLNIIEEVEIMLCKIADIASEPQTNIPDIFLWLMSGTQRLAFVRVPAKDILFSHEERWSGSKCGIFQSFSLHYPEDPQGSDIAGIVRGSLWLGREEEFRSWWSSRPDLQLTVFAESYENQVVSVPGTGKWTTKGSLMRRPPFSDADGFKSLPKENFLAPSGWTFQGDWIVDPDPSIKYESDAGHTVFCEEVFEQQARVPGGTWLDAPNQWTDIRGDPATPREEIDCPNGWKWRDVWETDLQRAVDSEGWEYTVQRGVTGWSPQAKLYHVLRRRRWIRERNRVSNIEKEITSLDGWEYSTLFSRRFHALERKIDIVRRRRWRRKLVPADEGLPATPRILLRSNESEDEIQITCPRQYVISAEIHTYQLRAHMYQARDLIAGDKSGFSDPYALVSFCESTQQTQKQSQTLCPTWDQTLVFNEVKLAGQLLPKNNIYLPPCVFVEVYDWDARGEPEFLGRVCCDPEVFDPKTEYTTPTLKWYKLRKGSQEQGEILAAFELILKDSGELPMPPPSKGDMYMVPFGIRPLLQKTRIEILCWGVRNMTTYELQSVMRPSIEFECGGKTVSSKVMKNIRTNPNFDSPYLYFDVELPKEELYLPPLVLRVTDHRSFGSKPLVATASINDLFEYNLTSTSARRSTLLARSQRTEAEDGNKDKYVRTICSKLNSSQASIEPGTLDIAIDWWAKFYASTNEVSRCGSYLRKGYERLEIMDHQLEDDNRFNSFKDLVNTIPLFRGRQPDSYPAGEFKGTFRIYPLPNDESSPARHLADYPSPMPQDIIARVYVISAKDLAPRDAGSSSDPYVRVKFGKDSVTSKKEYKIGVLNPIFGRVFEVKGIVPLVKDLKIQIWDHDLISTDDLIGETIIDVENRLLTRFRATVGLPKQYHVTGPNAWRDCKVPSLVLEETAKTQQMDGPHWKNESIPAVVLDGKRYVLKDFETDDMLLPLTIGEKKERLALHVLNSVFDLVPEHVESRSLYHPERPGLSQGTVQLWVDLFPSGVQIPPAVDIRPRKPTRFILRICIYNVYEAPLQETNFVGEKMSDVYVKGWLQGTDNVQKTDIHYRSMDGEANFNWRFVYPLDFLEAEQIMVIKRNTNIFSSTDAEDRRPPKLTLQLWDNDLLLRDDYLSEMTLNLCHLPKPSKSLKNVRMYENIAKEENVITSNGTNTTLIMPNDDDMKIINLFEVKRVYGYFPFIKTNEDGTTEIAGKLEAEFEVLPAENSNIRPAGIGRDEPNANPFLAEPERPKTSFFWLTSPWKSFRFVLWRHYKWYIITFIVLFFMALFVFLLLYSLPGAAADYLVGVD